METAATGGNALIPNDLNFGVFHRFRIFRLQNPGIIAILRLVQAKKKQPGNQVTAAPAKVRVGREIRLRPSTSDYETFVQTTAIAMGKAASPAFIRKPNRRLLSLLNLGV